MPYISHGLIMFNVVIALGYILVAALTNTYLLKKDDKLTAEDQQQQSRVSHSSQERRIGYTGPSSNVAKLGMPLGRSNASDSGRGTPTPVSPTPMRNTNTTPTPGTPLPVSEKKESFEDTNLLTPRSRRRAMGQPANQKRRTKIFQDYSCWFFMLIIVFCLSRATVLITMTMVGSKQTISMGGSRKEQDYLVMVPTILFYCVFIVLLHAMYYLSDTGRHKNVHVYRLRLMMMLSVCLLAILAGILIDISGGSAMVLEFIGCGIELVLTLLYAFTAVYLPKKLRGYGPVTHEICVKVFRVSLIVACSMFVRGILLLPPMQNLFARELHSYTLSLLMCMEFIPVIFSIRIMHGSSRPPRAMNTEPTEV